MCIDLDSRPEKIRRRRIVMTRIIVRLWGYQVGPRIFKLRPFGHLFVEYVALGSKEESWIFRGGPEIIPNGLIVLKAVNSAKSQSLDGPSTIGLKMLIMLDQSEIVTKRFASFSSLRLELDGLAGQVNRMRIVYKLLFDNSNSVANLVWNFLTDRDPKLLNNPSRFYFSGRKSESLQRKVATKVRSAAFSHRIS